MFSPQIGLDVRANGHDSPISEERATPYSYSARLTRYDIAAELSPTRNAVLYRFTFPAGDRAHLLLDLAHQVPKQIATFQPGSVLASTVTVAPDGRSVSGSSRYQGGFGGEPYDVYFHAEIDTPPVAFGTFLDGEVDPVRERSTTRADERTGGWWRFAGAGPHSVQVKIGISFRDVPRARAHLAREIPGWDLREVREGARAAWAERLGRIRVTGGDPAMQTQFYTALYHAQQMPRDRTGEFARFAPGAPMWDDHYAVWDTWRTKFPLMIWVDPDMVRGVIASFSERLRVDGRLRDSFTAAGISAGSQADQGGNDLDNIIADAYVKGLKGVDWAAAYAVMRHNAERERRGTFGPRASVDNPANDTDAYRRRGWLPPGPMNVSNTLEYAYNDFAVAQVARGLGRTDDAERYAARSRAWQVLFNPEMEEAGFTGFVMPRNDDGSWVPVNLIKFPGSWKLYFYEAASWGYSFYAPHQAARLIEMMGGEQAFVRRLEHGLETGKVDFSNEPAFLTPALFHYAGRPDLSAKWVRRFANQLVDATGYPGDDDSGAMSAYYVWAAAGLFPNAGQDLYLLNGPLFDRVVIQRPEEGRLTIIRRGSGDYVRSVTLNGVRSPDHGSVMPS